MATESVFAEIFAQTEAYVLPPPWEFLTTYQDYRLLPDDREGLWRHLCERYPREELIEQNVAQQDEAGTLQLCSLLRETRAPILGIREFPGSPVFGLTVDLQYLGPPEKEQHRHLYILARQPFEDSEAKKIVLVHDMVQAAIASSMELLCVPVAPLATACATELRRILELQFFATASNPLDRRGPERQRCYFEDSSEYWDQADLSRLYQLVVPTFDFANPTTQCLAGEGTVAVLRELIHLFPAPWQFARWQASAQICNRLSFQAQHDLPLLRVQTLKLSFEEDCVELEDLDRPSPTPIERMQLLTQHLVCLIQRGASYSERSNAWRELNDLLDEARIKPLLAAAQAADDSLRREQLFALASLAQIALPLMFVEFLRLRVQTEQLVSAGVWDLYDKQIGELASPNTVNLFSKYNDTLKEMLGCKKSRSRRSRTQSRFGRSDSRFRRSRSPR